MEDLKNSQLMHIVGSEKAHSGENTKSVAKNLLIKKAWL